MLHFIPTSILRRFSHTSYRSLSSHTTNYLASQLNSFIAHQFLDLHPLLQSHALIITSGNSSNVFFAAKLISLYGFHHKPNPSTTIFDSMPSKDTFLWNSIIKSHFSNGDYHQAFEFYERMRLSNTPPNNFTIPMAVSACAELLELGSGEMIHSLVVRLGIFGGNSAIGSSFVYFYVKCGRLKEAEMVFDEMPMKDVVSWTALVVGFVQNGESRIGLEYLCNMHRVGEDSERPNARTVEAGFLACGNLGALSEGKCLHGLAIKNGFGRSRDIQSSVLSLYSKCGTPEEAYSAFWVLEDKDIVSWTSIITVHAKLGLASECLSLFRDMQHAGICPDGVAISCLLSTFGDGMWITEGKVIHGLVMRRNYIVDPVVHNALMSMYCKLGKIHIAERLFDKENNRNRESWNMMIMEYNKMGLYKSCIETFQEMQQLGIECSLNSFISAISSCSQLCAIRLGISLHCFMLKNHQLCENISISNSLIDMYGKYGKLDLAKQVFSRMETDTVSWNTLIAACTRAAHFAEAIKFFDRMISEGLKPNSATLITVLSACSQLASLDDGERIHKLVIELGIELSLPLATALIDMYGKCGQLEKSSQIFNSMNTKDVISWNVMISCYGLHGDPTSAIEIFNEMEKSSVAPNELTFLAVLSACSHGGLVKEGRHLFGKMKDYSITPTLKHYACMVDLLGKSGNLKEAEDMVLSMPITPDGGIWGALLSACKTHNELEMGMKIARHAIESDPENDGYYIMLSNLLDSSSEWENAEMVRKMMKERGVRRRTGWSAV